MHDDLGDKQSFVIDVQKVDKLFKLIEFFQADFEGLFHITVLKAKLINKLWQFACIEVILLRSRLLDLLVDFVVLMVVILKFEEIAELEIDESIGTDDEGTGGEVDSPEFVGF